VFDAASEALRIEDLDAHFLQLRRCIGSPWGKDHKVAMAAAIVAAGARYSALTSSVLVGIEATGSMFWFLKLMEELKIECRVGHPAEIRAAEPRKQKHDRRDARLLLNLLVENRFSAIWMPSTEQRDLRTVLRHRHQWVQRPC